MIDLDTTAKHYRPIVKTFKKGHVALARSQFNDITLDKYEHNGIDIHRFLGQAGCIDLLVELGIPRMFAMKIVPSRRKGLYERRKELQDRSIKNILVG